MKYNNYNTNISFTHSSNGKERYFKISREGEKRNPGSVYVWFDDGKNVERMWVKITEGNKEKGSGVLINSPINIRVKYGDYVEFKKQKDNIIYAGDIYEGPFCECCGDAIHDETEIEKTRLN
jgi:uncharacterized protein YegJ (DUF2314 family)|tara:strand:- start:874 stop:1239 length:366 start_codon:yes stop_codon:yes gene_type:complete